MFLCTLARKLRGCSHGPVQYGPTVDVGVVMEAVSDSNWLMQYRILRLVNQCRRLIQSEFGEKLHLTDDTLREMLAQFAGRSRNQALQRVYAELRLALIDLEGPDELVSAPAAPAGQRRYRGQVIPDAPKAPTPEPAASSVESAARTGVTLVYRGQVQRR
jgi:hypothetical protein